MYIPEDVKNAINEMFLCRDMLEHMACYQKYNKELKDCTFVVFSETQGNELPEPLCTNYNNEFAVINLGCTDRCYAVNQKIYEEMCRTGETILGVDISVELDTQAVSYLKTVFKEYGQIPEYRKIKPLVQYLQLQDVNYSCLPYLLENAAKKEKIDQIECYKNIKSYFLFKAFEMKNGVGGYCKLEEDILIDVDILYNDVFSDKFVCAYRDLIEMQKAIYVLLLEAICIEFKNPKKSVQSKMMELIDFVNEKLGFVADRELEICYRYFNHDERTKKFFKRVQKNAKNLLGAIDGMAWDLIHIRLLERGYMTKVVEEVTFALPLLLTYDNGLKEILQINPIEQLAFYKDIPIPKLKNHWISNIPGAEEKIRNNIKKRYQTFEVCDIEELKQLLEETCKGLLVS